MNRYQVIAGENEKAKVLFRDKNPVKFSLLAYLYKPFT